MRNIFRIFFSDIKSVTRHFFAFIIIIAITVIPALYAWFNIYANWDPYGSTGNVSIAVASDDKPYTLEDGSVVNMGRDVMEELKSNDSINWVLLDNVDAARAGVEAGDYYAAILIGENFTYDMYNLNAALTDKDATLTYYENAKKNAIACKITETAAETVEHSIQTKYLEVLFESVFAKGNEVGEQIDEDELLATVTKKLTDLQADLNSYCASIDSFTADSQKLENLLSGASVSTGDVSAITDGGRDSVSAAQSTIASSRASIKALSDGLDSRLSEVETILNELADTLGSITAPDADTELIDKSIELVNELQTKLQSIRSLFPDSSLTSGAAYVCQTLDALIDRADELQSQLGLLKKGGDTAENLANIVSACSSTVSHMKSLFTDSLIPGVDTMLNNMYSLLDMLSPLLDSIDVTAADIQPVLNSAKSTVGYVTAALSELRKVMSSASDKIGDVLSQIVSGDSDEKLQALIDLLGGDAAQYAEFFASPVDVTSVAVYDSGSYGSAMAPFYSVLAIWVGGVILVAIIKVRAEPRGLSNVTESQRFFGRFMLMWLIGQLQAAVIVLGDIYLLGCQCLSPWLFWLAASVTSFVFTMLIYSLTLAFGDVGKAIVVVIMVVQIAGSSGSYPIEILPDIFGNIYTFFPFPYAINAMRETICGMYGYDYYIYLGQLLIFGVIGLLIGLLVRRPFIGVSRYVEEEMDETQVL